MWRCLKAPVPSGSGEPGTSLCSVARIHTPHLPVGLSGHTHTPTTITYSPHHHRLPLFPRATYNTQLQAHVRISVERVTEKTGDAVCVALAIAAVSARARIAVEFTKQGVMIRYSALCSTGSGCVTMRLRLVMDGCWTPDSMPSASEVLKTLSGDRPMLVRAVTYSAVTSHEASKWWLSRPKSRCHMAVAFVLPMEAFVLPPCCRGGGALVSLAITHLHLSQARRARSSPAPVEIDVSAMLPFLRNLRCFFYQTDTQPNTHPDLSPLAQLPRLSFVALGGPALGACSWLARCSALQGLVMEQALRIDRLTLPSAALQCMVLHNVVVFSLEGLEACTRMEVLRLGKGCPPRATTFCARCRACATLGAAATASRPPTCYASALT